jgi:hypothetical protein
MVRALLADWVAPTQWGGCCAGVNRAILEVFVSETRQQALARLPAPRTPPPACVTT